MPVKRKNESSIVNFLAFLLFLATISCSAGKQSFPVPEMLPSPDWRAPTGADIIGDDWRNEHPRKYLAADGDFNGDGINDAARLLISNERSEIGLFAFISQKNGTFAVILLDKITNRESIHRLGIRKVSRGSYKTACGKGYWECSKDEVPVISIAHEAIDYFVFESANSFFYWDDKTQTFRTAVISD